MNREPEKDRMSELPDNTDQSDVPPRAGPGSTGPPVDTAQQSLADALRVSFRILTVIMVFVVVAYLLTGVKSIEPQQEGILKIFGKQVGLAREGLVYTWPFPIGEIELITTSQQELLVDDFWMHETPEDKTKELSERQSKGEGLRPGWDGVLLTGDRNLLHVELICKYSIRRPLAYSRHVLDTREMIRSAICRAAIRAAANRTADGIQRGEKQQFVSDIHEAAQHELNALLETPDRHPGIRISQVQLIRSSWPIKALSAFNEAQRAGNEADKRESAARAEATEILNKAVGPANIKILVGDPIKTGPDGESASTTTGPAQERKRQYDLIGQYGEALKADRRKEEAGRLLKQIDEVLLRRDTEGEASRILSEARGQRTAIEQNAEYRYKRFKQLVAEYRRSPELMLARHWAGTLDEILSSPTVEKFYLPFGSGKAVTVWHIGSDPRVLKKIRREVVKQKKDKGSK